MMIESVRLHRFRNYENQKISFPKATILLYGQNGQGKTNLLESLYLGGIGKSYRGIADSDLISWEHDKASVIIDFNRNDTTQQIKVILSKLEKKELWVNETKVSQKELIGTLNEVLFSPDDLQLIKGSPSLRRRFIDMEISQVSRSYYRDLLQYNRAVSQRNLLLKKMKYNGSRSLDEWDRQIAGFAASIVSKRLEALQKLSFLAGVLHKRLSRGKEMLHLTYVQPYGNGDGRHQTDPKWYYDCLQQHLPEDIRRQATSVGPHRDDLLFSVGQGDLKKYGSQGQQRTAVLALKLSELEFIKSETGEYPVLLLDDVMSELDQSRRQALLDFVRNRIQTFITTTEPDIFAGMDGCHPICIEQGRVVSNGEAKS